MGERDFFQNLINGGVLIEGLGESEIFQSDSGSQEK